MILGGHNVVVTGRSPVEALSTAAACPPSLPMVLLSRPAAGQQQLSHLSEASRDVIS